MLLTLQKPEGNPLTQIWWTSPKHVDSEVYYSTRAKLGLLDWEITSLRMKLLGNAFHWENVQATLMFTLSYYVVFANFIGLKNISFCDHQKWLLTLDWPCLFSQYQTLSEFNNGSADGFSEQILPSNWAILTSCPVSQSALPRGQRTLGRKR